MVKISAEEFAEEWGKSEETYEASCVRLYLTPEQIQEWIKHGKFSKIKEYCQQLPYQVKMTCLKPLYNAKGKSFGFVLKTHNDARLLAAVWYAIKEKRTCREVEKISFQELRPHLGVFSAENVETIGATCPLVI